MKIKDLTYCKYVPSEFSLKGEQKFIHFYGQINCRYLKAKSSDEILSILHQQMPNEILLPSQIAFINSISNKEVLVYLYHSHQDNPDIFVYLENNTPFTLECFV